MAKKVYVGIGHGGSDPGAVGNGFKEKNLTLSIGNYCTERFKQYGIEVKQSRTTDKDVTIDTKVRESDRFGADVCMDIHINAGGGNGAEVYYRYNSAASKRLANSILTAVGKIGQNSRGAKIKMSGGTDYFGMVRRPKAVSVLVECAFIDTSDIQIINTAAKQKTFGYAIADGVAAYLGVKMPTAQKPNTSTTKPTNTPNTSTSTSFFPAKGYFGRGDTHANVGKIAAFMRKVFPSYTPKAALGNYYGDNIVKAVKEFQRRTGLEPDGSFGPLTLKELESFGFKK